MRGVHAEGPGLIAGLLSFYGTFYGTMSCLPPETCGVPGKPCCKTGLPGLLHPSQGQLPFYSGQKKMSFALDNGHLIII